MGKKICYTLCLAVCLLLAVSVSAFAAEVPVVALPEIAPAVLHTKSEPTFSLFSEPLAWGEDSTCYRDQLYIYCESIVDTTAIDLYDRLASAFWADWNGNNRMELAGVKFSDGHGGSEILNCWVTPSIVDDWHGNIAWYKEQYPGYCYLEDEHGNTIQDEYGNDKLFEYWEVMIKNDAVLWINEQLSETMQTGARIAVNAFVSDHPEYFWVRADGGLGSELVKTEEEWVASVYYGFVPKAGCETLEKRVALQEEIEDVVANLQKQTAGMTSVQKITYWDNWLASNNIYNSKAAELGTTEYLNGTDSTPWSIVGALLDGYQPVCEGYAKALQLLCKWNYEEVAGISIDMSIPCLQISGEACDDMTKDPQIWEPHMWLAIRMEDDNWYYCDPTWNDPAIRIYDVATDTYTKTEYSYSSRQHLLTAQPNDHTTYYDPRLGTPTLSPVSYFVATGTTVEETMSTWEVTEDGLTGMEAGSGAMMVILYDENGKMLDLGFCAQGAQCGEDSWFYLAPVFDAEDLAQATRIVRINVGDKTAWSPLTALKAIKEAPEVDPPEAE